MTARVYLGTSGFGFAHWTGRFYPRGTKPDEMLRHYAKRFDTVEINSSYYAMPTSTMLEKMREKVPERFAFVVKANQAMTHAPGVDEAACKAFDEALAPLRESGQLAAILLQFPNGFRPGDEQRDKVARLREKYAKDAVIVEYRHKDWLSPTNLSHARALDMGWCSVDEPRLPGLVPALPVATNRDGYVRFHGRNQGSWYGDDGEQRYNHAYRARELREWAPGLKQLSERTQRLFLFLNNCHLGHAAKNATQVEAMLREMGATEQT